MSTQRRAVWAVPLVLGALMGCGGGGTPGGDAAAAGDAATKSTTAAVENPAVLNVTVNFAGAAPAPKAIDMAEEKACADKHVATGGPKTNDVLVSNGKLQNVFVYVKEGLSGTYSPPAENVVVDQNGCVYQPHVVGVLTGQNLVYRNSDGILHNVKAVPTEQMGFNISQPGSGDSPTKTFNTKEVMVPVECNVHGWMKSFVGVLDHPYFAVSAADGSASIGNLPPGTYTIEAWHEKFGTKTQSVTVGPNETKAITFDFSAATATRVPLGKPLVLDHAAHGASHGGN